MTNIRIQSCWVYKFSEIHQHLKATQKNTDTNMLPIRGRWRPMKQISSKVFLFSYLKRYSHFLDLFEEANFELRLFLLSFSHSLELKGSIHQRFLHAYHQAGITTSQILNNGQPDAAILAQLQVHLQQPELLEDKCSQLFAYYFEGYSGCDFLTKWSNSSTQDGY